MDLREPTAEDGTRIHELVESAMTTSYRLSPGQLEAVAEEQFAPDVVAAKAESDDTVVRVAEVDADGATDEEPVVAGYVEGRVREPRGELRWLFVDPEHRGRGVGAALYEAGTEALTDAGATELVGATLEANAEGGEFFESYGLAQVDDREVELGGEQFREYLYAEPNSAIAADAEAGGAEADEASADHADVDDEPEQLPDDPAEMELPNTETTDGTTTATTGDGQRVVLALDEMESGTTAPFFVTYEEEAREDRYGYYCGNCGSLDVTVDAQDRLACDECGNDHAERSSEAYDDAYL